MPKAPFPPPVGQEKPYEMKAMAWKRTPCPLVFELTVQNRVFRVPAQVVCDNRDDHYGIEDGEGEDTWGFICEGTLCDNEIEEWALNNMNWSDVAPWAYEIPTEPHQPTEREFQEVWLQNEGELELLDLTPDEAPADSL